MSRKPTSPPLAVLLGLAAISGGSGLMYELLWVRALGLHFGTTTPAITTVVATFMGGLGIGYVWFGPRADRSPRPFALYQRLELIIAGTGLAASLVLQRGGSLLDALARLCAGAGALSTLCMALVLAVIMLVPTTAMGGTVPVLASALARGTPAARALSLLYASNTLGAIAGALIPDFIAIPNFGVTATACLAAAGNLTAALAVRNFARAERANPLAPAHEPVPLRAAEPLTHDAAGTPATATLSAQRLVALALTAATGFCSLGLEVLWSRTLQHWAAALVTSFAVLLATYLAALSAGAFLTQRLAMRSRAPLSAAGLLVGATALCVAVSLWAAPPWRDVARAWWPRPEGMRRVGLKHESIDALLHAGFLELLPCLLLGATFPFIAAAWLADGKAGTRSGQLFVVNTFAAVLGSLVAGLWWLPQFGEQASYCAFALVLASVAALCAFLVAGTERARLFGVGSAACLAGVLALTLALPADHLFRAHFRTGGQLLAVEEGATTTAAAAARFIYGEPHYVELLTPGISMSSTRGDARRYMSMMAHAPLLAARGSERALLICYGVGNTASALLAHPELKHLDVVDISPEVLALSPQFAAARGDDPLRDPRTRVFVDDGRHHLITRDTRYDVITAEPPPPNYAGVANLYSREFYRLARTRLAAGGVITQWLPVFQLSDDDVRVMIAAFVAELPHTALLYGYEQQLILIGSPEPLVLRPSANAALTQAMRHSYIGGVEHVLGSVLQTDAELRRQVAGIEPLSDERPVIEYLHHNIPEGTYYTATFTPDPTRAWSLLAADSDPALRERTRAASEATDRALASISLRDREPAEARELALGRQLGPVLTAHPHDQGLWLLAGVDRDRVRLAELALRRPGASELLARPHPDRARYFVLQDALWLLARRAFYARDCRNALDYLQRIHLEPADKPRHALFTAGCLRALGQAEASAEAFRRAAAESGDPAFRAASLQLADRAVQPSDSSASPWAPGD